VATRRRREWRLREVDGGAEGPFDHFVVGAEAEWRI